MLSGSRDLLILAQFTLREVLKVDVMRTLQQTIWGLRDHGGGDFFGTDWAGAEDMDMGNGKDVGEERVGPTMCGQQAAHVAVEAFCAAGEMFTPDKAQEAAVKENLLQRAPRMFIEMVEGKREHEEVLKMAVDSACQHDLTPSWGERLRWLVLEKYPGVLR